MLHGRLYQFEKNFLNHVPESCLCQPLTFSSHTPMILDWLNDRNRDKEYQRTRWVLYGGHYSTAYFD
jgi:hypothetical protein